MAAADAPAQPVASLPACLVLVRMIKRRLISRAAHTDAPALRGRYTCGALHWCGSWRRPPVRSTSLPMCACGPRPCVGADPPAGGIGKKTHAMRPRPFIARRAARYVADGRIPMVGRNQTKAERGGAGLRDRQRVCWCYPSRPCDAGRRGIIIMIQVPGTFASSRKFHGRPQPSRHR
jgi:hypothetical protein